MAAIWLVSAVFVFRLPDAIGTLIIQTYPTSQKEATTDSDLPPLPKGAILDPAPTAPLPTPPPGFGPVKRLDTPNDPFAKYATPSYMRKETAYRELRSFLMFGIGAPIALIVLGWAMAWIARGFMAE